MMPTSPTLHWFALKVFYNKVFDVEARLQQYLVETYVPCETVLVEHKGVKKKIRKPAIASLLFFRSTERHALELQRLFDGRAMLYTTMRDQKHCPAIISEQEMNVFMLVSSSGQQGLDYLGDDKVEYHTGEHVRVIDGPFKGAEGYIRRIKGDRRLVVSVQGVCAVATSYIPRCFLQKVEE